MPQAEQNFSDEAEDIIFSEEEFRSLMLAARSAVEIIPHVVLSPNTDTVPANIDTFTASTSSRHEDIIKYTTDNDVPLDLNKLDGGFI